MQRTKPKKTNMKSQSKPRPVPQIVNQLHDLLQLKQTAVANARGEFADSLMFDTILKQEESLYAELRSALGPAQKRPQAVGLIEWAGANFHVQKRQDGG